MCIECMELISNSSKTSNKTADNRNRILTANRRELKVIYMRTQRLVYTTTWSKDCPIKRRTQSKMRRKLNLRDKVSRTLGSQWRETRCKHPHRGSPSSALTAAAYITTTFQIIIISSLCPRGISSNTKKFHRSNT